MTRIVPYDGGPVPDNAMLRTSPSLGWAVAGGFGFLLSYGPSATIAAGLCPPAGSQWLCDPLTPWLYVPGIGPFVTAGAPHASFGARSLAILDGAVQSASITAIVAVLATRKQELELHERVPVATRKRRPRVALVPGASSAAAGASLRVSGF